MGENNSHQVRFKTTKIAGWAKRERGKTRLRSKKERKRSRRGKNNSMKKN